MLSQQEPIVNPLSKSDLNKKSLCDYVINVASGCYHGCSFCYVPSTPVIRMRAEELKSRGVEDPQMDWGKYLFVRSQIPEKLDAILQTKRKWKETASGRGIVMLSSGTDPYQNGQTAKVTRETVKVLLKYNKRVRILTRSPLWVKDLDILVHPNVTVGMSIPHLNDDLSRQIEPGAPLPSDRLKALEKGRQAGIRLYIAMAPTPPILEKTAVTEAIGRFAELSPEVIFWETINARGTNKKRMLAAGLTWANEIETVEQSASSFMSQLECVMDAASSCGLEDLIHIWPDAEVAKKLKFQSGIDVTEWFYKPTVEKWVLD